MTKEVTPSIPKLEGTKSNLNLTYIYTPHWGQEVHEVHIGVHSEPKPNIKGYHHENL
jgi:hypothetical protein